MNGKNPESVEALHWEKIKGGKAWCHLCPIQCKISEGKTGVCGVKKNVGGTLLATAYGRTTSFNTDPIEKKPLYHFYPGTNILSVGLNACNLNCLFCQNYQVSQLDASTRYMSPEYLAEAAGKDGSIGVAYTYTEPLMWYEYILDAAEKVKEKGLKNVLVTNAHIEETPFREILPLIDALNIDVKSMDADFYKKICKGKLNPVLKNVELAAEKAHVEITNLIIPTLNDDDSHFERLASFVADIDPLIPLHFSRYHPAYKMDTHPTPVETLLRAKDIALKKIKYVYIGNVSLPGGNDTLCPHCGTLLIERDYMGAAVSVKNGNCLECGKKVNIIS